MWLASVNPEAMRKKKYCCLANVNHHTHIIQWKHLHSKVLRHNGQPFLANKGGHNAA